MIKAAPWQRPALRWISLAPLAVLVALAAASTVAGASSLPSGLPDLPALGSGMQRDPRSGLALRGFDPVAYHFDGRPVAGKPDHELLQGGMIWRFASAANLEAFRSAPEFYLPAFDGLDALAVSQGFAADADTRFFALSAGRLYLFASARNRDGFLAQTRSAQLADENWRRSLHRATQ